MSSRSRRKHAIPGKVQAERHDLRLVFNAFFGDPLLLSSARTLQKYLSRSKPYRILDTVNARDIEITNKLTKESFTVTL